MTRTLHNLFVAILLLTAAAPGGALQRDGSPYLSLAEARQVMLDLINQDRASAGLRPVKLDETATKAGQAHAEEMAVNRYLAHLNMAGMSPMQRYTEAGGADSVSENVYLLTHNRTARPGEPLPLVRGPVFTREELAEIQRAYFNEVPPHDGHRRNILRPGHTHVGIGLAKGSNGEVRTLANAQEFVTRILEEVAPLPRAARIGQTVRVEAALPAGVRFRYVVVARLPDAKPLSATVLNARPSYPAAAPLRTVWDEAGLSLPLDADRARRHVSVPVAFTAEDGPGLYLLTAWVRTADGADVPASQRTITVR